MKTGWANVTRAAKKTTGHDCKMDTLLAEGTTKRGGAVITAARNATGATSREVANSGYLASI
jgi:hypothetical protein